MKIFVSTVVAMLVSYPIFATGSVTSTVNEIRMDQSGNGMVFFAQNITGTRPGCMIAFYQNALAFNTNTAGGKAIYAMVLAAKLNGSAVTATGLGTCSVFGGFAEDWDTGHID